MSFFRNTWLVNWYWFITSLINKFEIESPYRTYISKTGVSYFNEVIVFNFNAEGLLVIEIASKSSYTYLQGWFRFCAMMMCGWDLAGCWPELPSFSLKLVQIINNYQICFVHGQRSQRINELSLSWLLIGQLIYFLSSDWSMPRTQLSPISQHARFGNISLNGQI